MLLPLVEGLVRTTHFDSEMACLADRHYSRRTVGARQFLYSGRKLVLRNTEGTVLFAWLYPDPTMRMDGQKGYNCAIFRNESGRAASEIILEAEKAAFEKWGPDRLYTYVDPAKRRRSKCATGESSDGATSRRDGSQSSIRTANPTLAKPDSIYSSSFFTKGTHVYKSPILASYESAKILT